MEQILIKKKELKQSNQMWTLKVGDVVLHRKDSIRNNDKISWDWAWQDFLRLSLIQVE